MLGNPEHPEHLYIYSPTHMSTLALQKHHKGFRFLLFMQEITATESKFLMTAYVVGTIKGARFMWWRMCSKYTRVRD